MGCQGSDYRYRIKNIKMNEVIIIGLVSIATNIVWLSLFVFLLKKYTDQQKYYIKALLSKDSRQLAESIKIEEPTKEKRELDNSVGDNIPLDQLIDDEQAFDKHIESINAKSSS